MTENQIIDILWDLTNEKHSYSDAQNILAINYAINKIRSYNNLASRYNTLVIDHNNFKERVKHEIPIRDNY